MATTIKDPEGNLLWQANDFGLYSVMKTDAITEILSELLQDITVKVETHSGDEPITNVYTKEEADARFIQILMFPMILEGQIAELIQEDKIVGKATINLVNSRLLQLFMFCFGTDLDDPPHQVQVGANTRILNLEDMSDFLFTRVTRISSDIYLHTGTEIDINTLVIAKLEDTGLKTDLSPTIADTTTMVAAINSVNSEVKTATDNISDLDTRVTTLENQNGSETLTTTAQTLSGAVNELDSELGTSQGDISTLQSDVGGLQSDVGDLQSDVSNLQSAVGDITTLDSGFSTQEVVAALNQLISSVNTLSGQISALDQRVTDLGG